MKWIRAVGAVLLGYVVSQGVNGVLVYYFYVADNVSADVLVVPVTVIAFVLAGLLAGELTARAAGAESLLAVRALTGLIVLVTVGNIVMDVATEPLWHKLVVLAVMAPAVLWVGSRHASGEAGLV